jgi:hypothetical protein
MPETDKSIVIAEIDEIKWQSNTGQSVLKSKGLYRTGVHFTGLVRRSDGISFSLQSLVKQISNSMLFLEIKYNIYLAF